MGIFEYAMQMEKDGENFYRGLAEKVSNKGVKTILTMLADEEVKHYEILSKAQSEEEKLPETTILDDAKNVFMQMKEGAGEFDVGVGQVELYREAREIEERSRGFYLEKSEQVEQGRHKELFLKVADEEKKHCFLLDNIIEFVSRPEHWLEDAEFYHLEEY